LGNILFFLEILFVMALPFAIVGVLAHSFLKWINRK